MNKMIDVVLLPTDKKINEAIYQLKVTSNNTIITHFI